MGVLDKSRTILVYRCGNCWERSYVARIGTWTVVVPALFPMLARTGEQGRNVVSRAIYPLSRVATTFPVGERPCAQRTVQWERGRKGSGGRCERVTVSDWCGQRHGISPVPAMRFVAGQSYNGIDYWNAIRGSNPEKCWLAVSVDDRFARGSATAAERPSGPKRSRVTPRMSRRTGSR